MSSKQPIVHSADEILEYWNRPNVESMYDKHLLNAEIALIRERIPPNSKILDAGCGEGEGTLAYARIPGVTLVAVDFSETRLNKATVRLAGCSNVVLKQVDMLKGYSFDDKYDVVVSQRFLINFTEWALQAKVLRTLVDLAKPGGKLLLLEGSRQGVDSLNEVRSAWSLPSIEVKWHNLFFDDAVLVDFMGQRGCHLCEETGLGAYFLLTRGIRPNLDSRLDWDCEFNRVAATRRMEELLQIGARFSRLKLWVFEKRGR